MHFYSQIRRGRSGQRGYIMLTLLLMMAMMIIFAAVIVPSVTFDIKRDREEEMIHRGVQYSRAIRAYYKKFGRYPIRLEDLESTNNMRFLRKRYKDPLNCKPQCQDFKLLHFGEVQLTLSGMSGGTIAGATQISAMGGSTNSGGFGQSSAFGQSSTFGQSSSFGQSSGFGQSSAFGGNSANSSFGGNSNSASGQNQPGTNTQPGSDASQSGSPDSTGAPSGTGNNPGSNQPGSGQIIGGPIVGVASTSKDNTIREFNHKKKYKDWVFVYDPAQDQGRLITTPYQPLQGFGQQGTPNLNGQNGSSNPSNSFGSSNGVGSSGFGNSPSGFQNTPNNPSPGGFGNSSQPSNPQQQQ